MRGRILLGVAFGLVALASPGAGASDGTAADSTFCPLLSARLDPCLVSVGMEADVSTSPSRLPPGRGAPVALRLVAQLSDRGAPRSPAALRRLAIDLDRAYAIDSSARPAGQVVGAGRAAVHIAGAPAGRVVSIPLTLRRVGLRRGATVVVARGADPRGRLAPFAIRGTLRPLAAGRYGTRATWRIPRLAAGRGALASLSLRLGQAHVAEDRWGSLVSARCIDGNLHARIARAEFVAEQATPQTHTTLKGTLVRTCTPAP